MVRGRGCLIREEIDKSVYVFSKVTKLYTLIMYTFFAHSCTTIKLGCAEKIQGRESLQFRSLDFTPKSKLWNGGN